MAAVSRIALAWMPALRWSGSVLSFLWLALCVALPGPARADTDGTNAAERQVKAAYLSKFASYIEWPPAAFATSDAPFNIGVLGDEGMAAYVSQLVAGRTANGRPVKVHALRADSQVAGMHILFIGGAYKAHLHQLLSGVRHLPLLTVTETDDALAHGSMINFVTVDGRVRFEVSQKAAQPNHVRISARLLSAATRVIVGRQQ